MRNKIIFALVAVGLAGAVFSAYLYAKPAQPQPPAFEPASNPYGQGIFANGIVESFQTQGENINIYPEVAGTVTQVLVAEGQSLTRGAPMVVHRRQRAAGHRRAAVGPGGGGAGAAQ